MSTDLTKLDALESVVVGQVVNAVAADEAISLAADAAEYALSIVVGDPKTHAEAEKAIVDITRGKKALEKHRKPVTQAIDRLKKAVMEYVGAISEPLNKADAYLGTQIMRYVAAQTAKAEEAARQHQAALAAATAAGAPPPIVRNTPAPATTPKADDGSGVGTEFRLSVELERPYDAPEHLLALAPGALAWMQEQLADGHLDLPKKDGATTLHRGIRATWTLGIKRRA